MRALRFLADFSPALARAIVLFSLGILPIVLYVGAGVISIWRSGNYQWVLWSAPALWLLAWILSRLWHPTLSTEAAALSEEFDIPLHWTPRDITAWEIIKSYQQRIAQLEARQLTDPQFYFTTAQELSTDLARHYHPHADDPVSSLTVSETLAALRLVADDLERWFLEAVPGSRLLTIGQWRLLSYAPHWWQRLSNATWVASILVNPANVLKYVVSQYTLAPISAEVKQELLAAAYLNFIRETGRYCVEMNSGRLRGGADEYRRHFSRGNDPSAGAGPAAANTTAGRNTSAPAITPDRITVLLMGQAKAGKSSLVNALLGERAGEVDVLPCTDAIASYQLHSPQFADTFTILDSPGYSETGMTSAQRSALQDASRRADVILLVLAAHQPAREADRLAVEELQQWYTLHAELKPAPMIAVLTHVDRLSPALEWLPPYDWRDPVRKKEHSIRGAVEYAHEVFGTSIRCAVPVRTDEGNVLGVEDELLPALASVLGESKAGAMLRTLFQNISQDRWQILWNQALTSGATLIRWWQESRKV